MADIVIEGELLELILDFASEYRIAKVGMKTAKARGRLMKYLSAIAGGDPLDRVCSVAEWLAEHPIRNKMWVSRAIKSEKLEARKSGNTWLILRG